MGVRPRVRVDVLELAHELLGRGPPLTHVAKDRGGVCVLAEEELEQEDALRLRVERCVVEPVAEGDAPGRA